MAVSTQEILNGVINMQANAQQALPVIPNNGNPAGAYNMPVTPQPVAVGQPAVPAPMARQPAPLSPIQNKYPWLAPSPSVDNMRSLLESRRTRFQQPVQEMPQTAEIRNSQLPILPLRNKV